MGRLVCRRAGSLVVVTALVAAGIVAGIAASAGGSKRATTLLQLRGTGGCVRADGKEACARSRGIDDALLDIVVSRDGRSVYASSWFGTLTTFSRSVDGRLQETGCVSDDGRRGCTKIGKLRFRPVDAAVSADGRNVYVASALDDTAHGGPYIARVTVFRRNRLTGRIVPLQGKRGCVAARAAAEGCTVARGFGFTVARGLGYPTQVAVSPDDKTVYVASFGPGGGLTVFSRSRSDGSLRQLPGGRGCLLGDSTERSCEHRDAAERGPLQFALSADGKKVFVLVPLRQEEASELIVLRRDQSGTLRPLAGDGSCVTGSAKPRSGCVTVVGLDDAEQLSLAPTPDGRNVYVGVADHLAVFETTDSRIRQLPNAAGCLSVVARTLGRCGAHSVYPFSSILLTSDGRTLFYAYDIGRYRPASPPQLVVLQRDPQTGVLRRAASGTCFVGRSQRSAAWCTHARALDGPGSLAMSPDGRNIYAAGFDDAQSSQIAVFRIVRS